MEALSEARVSAEDDAEEIGPFLATTDDDGKIKIDPDNLVYLDGGKKGQKAVIKAGWYLIRFADAKTGITYTGTTGPMKLKATGVPEPTPDTPVTPVTPVTPTPQNVDDEGSSGGCSAGVGALAAAMMAAAFLLPAKGRARRR